MKNFDAVVAALRSYSVVPSTHGFPRWYVYRTASAKAYGGEIPPDSITFFDKARAQSECDKLNARAVIDTWRYG